MISIRVDDKISPYLRKIMKDVPILAKHAMRDVVQAVHEKAMSNLYSNLTWGSTLGGDSIRDKVRVLEEGNKVTLEYFSPHASIVEYGAVGGLVVRQPGQGPPFAIGKSQGIPIPPKYSFRLQEGKHFLSRAIDEIVNSGRAEQIVINRFRGALGF